MLYEEETFCRVSNGGFFGCAEYGDSPDGLVGDAGVIEIKSVIAPVHYDTIQRRRFDPAYRWQMVGHLDCTGREWVDFVSYCADFPRESQLSIHRLYRGDFREELKQLAERRAEFLTLVSDVKSSIESRN
jgi:hypothetical protein